jgi:hypothetical protein
MKAAFIGIPRFERTRFAFLIGAFKSGPQKSENPSAPKIRIPEPVQADLPCPVPRAKIFRFFGNPNQ